MWYRLQLILLLVNLQFLSRAQDIPGELKHYIQKIQSDFLSGHKSDLKFKRVDRNIYYCSIEWELNKPATVPAVSVAITPAFKPGFNWAPHLTPDDNSIIPQHVFRAPALIVADKSNMISVVPDLDLLIKNTAIPWFMDMDATDNKLIIGLGKSKVAGHVLYNLDRGIIIPEGKTKLGFYILFSNKPEAIQNPWRQSLHFMWNRWAVPLYKNGEPLHQKNIEPYVQQTYEWAFKNWRKPVWQEFEMNGKKVGAPVFIVNTTQSPNYPGEVNEREFRSIWNQAWFNSLRSAQGLYRYAMRYKIDSLKAYALKTKELALAFPQKNGFFPGLIATEMESVEIRGEKYNRSKGWSTKYFGNSNRNPVTWDAQQSPYHIADMSFTAYWMLVWYEDLEKDQRLLSYAKNYADALLKLQEKDGFFPAWLSLENLQPLDQLKQSPETSISVTFLLKLYQLTKERRYFHAAKHAMEVVVEQIVPTGQWEDFETYWSCSRVGSQDWVGKKIKRNNQYKQNSFSIFWTAQALLEMYKTTNQKKYIEVGQRVLDELLMYQATWQPPFIAVHSLGGFGVMNADAEWNDSRQSLFAGVIADYGKVLNKQEYLQRSLSALRASFTMMYTPLNPETMQQWQARWPFFGSKDYGFMMENYGHDGVTDNKGLGIGEFTIYDWGNGAAAEAYNRMYDRYGARFMAGDFDK